MRGWQRYVGIGMLVAIWGCLVAISIPFSQMQASAPIGYVLPLLRVLIFVPLAVFLAIWAVNTFDRLTEGWWLRNVDNPNLQTGGAIAVGLVTSTLIYCIFWCIIQV